MRVRASLSLLSRRTLWSRRKPADAVAHRSTTRHPTHPGRNAAEDPADRETRLRAVHAACATLADGFENLEALVDEYVESVPLAVWEDEAADADSFLEWLGEQQELSDEQRDYLAWQQSHQAVGRVALKRRLAATRFRSVQAQDCPPVTSAESRTKVIVHLNPVHVWATLDTHALIGPEDSVPATVVFYASGGETQSRIVDKTQADLLRRLEHNGPTRLRDLLNSWSHEERELTLRTIDELAKAGLLAIA
jgi:hypothetical protein